MWDDILLHEIAATNFDGNAIEGEIRGKGPRRELIIKALNELNLNHSEDGYGNIWVEKGKIGEYKLFSSHMDVDAAAANIKNIDGRVEFWTGHYLYFNRDVKYVGIVDNAVGCYLNIRAAASDNSELRKFYVFTASEEENPEHPDDWGRSAQEVIKVLSQRGVLPELCIAIDVAFPELIARPDTLPELYNKLPAKELFNFNDKTHCYIDGLIREDAKDLADKILRAYNNPNIQIRHLTGFDEGKFYSSIAPSFAFGPVGFGKYTEPKQMMPKKNVESALEFLKFLVSCEILQP